MTCCCTLPYDQCCGARRCPCTQVYGPPPIQEIKISKETIEKLKKALKEALKKETS